jgi:hypothetical protein
MTGTRKLTPKDEQHDSIPAVNNSYSLRWARNTYLEEELDTQQAMTRPPSNGMHRVGDADTSMDDQYDREEDVDQDDDDDEYDDDMAHSHQYREDFIPNYSKNSSKFSTNKYEDSSCSNSFRNQESRDQGMSRIERYVQYFASLNSSEQYEFWNKLTSIHSSQPSQAYYPHVETFTEVFINPSNKLNIIGLSLLLRLRDSVKAACSSLEIRPCNEPFYLNGGLPVTSTRLAIVNIRIAGNVKPAEVYIVDSEIPFVIGGDFLREIGLVIGHASYQMWCEESPNDKFSFSTLDSGLITLPWTGDLHRVTNKIMKLREPVYTEFHQPIFILTEDDMYSAASNREKFLIMPPTFSNHETANYLLEVDEDEFVLAPWDSELDTISSPILASNMDSELDTISSPILARNRDSELDTISSPILASNRDSELDTISSPILARNRDSELDTISSPILARNRDNELVTISISTLAVQTHPIEDEEDIASPTKENNTYLTTDFSRKEYGTPEVREVMVKQIGTLGSITHETSISMDINYVQRNGGISKDIYQLPPPNIVLKLNESSHNLGEPAPIGNLKLNECITKNGGSGVLGNSACHIFEKDGKWTNNTLMHVSQPAYMLIRINSKGNIFLNQIPPPKVSFNISANFEKTFISEIVMALIRKILGKIFYHSPKIPDLAYIPKVAPG